MTTSHTDRLIVAATLVVCSLAAGVSDATAQTILSEEFDELPPSSQIDAFGASVDGAGDVDGDGHADMIVGSTGNAYLYRGSATGLETTPSWSVSAGGQKSGHFGSPLAALGDVNGDGYDDVATRSTGSYPNTSLNHKVYAYHGGQNPPPTALAGTATADRSYRRTIELEGSAPDGEPLDFAIETPPDHGTLTGPNSTGKSTAEVGYYARTNQSANSDSFEFRVIDPLGHSDTATVDVTIESPPSFMPPTPSGTLETRVGEQLQFSLAAEDPDGDDLTYGVEPTPEGAAFDYTTQEFTWTPTADQTGETELVLSVTDSVATVERPIDVTVDPPPGADVGVDAGGGDTGTRDVGPDADTTAPDGSDAGRDIGPEMDVATDPTLDTGPADTSDTRDTDPSDTSAVDAGPNGGGSDTPEQTGCGCTSSGDSVPVGWMVLLAVGLVGWVRLGDRQDR
jgi:MYXO-CTERM domain-containing protein